MPWDFIESGSPSSDTLAAFRDALDVLAELGAVIEDLTLPLHGHQDVLSVILLCEAAAYHAPKYARQPEVYGPSFRERLAPGFLFTAVDYLRAQRVRDEIRALVEDVMPHPGVLALPTMPTPAPSWANFQEVGWDLAPPPFTSLFSLTGHPAISVPDGISQSGLPLGLQLAAANDAEHVLAAVARAYESAGRWQATRPDMSWCGEPNPVHWA